MSVFSIGRTALFIGWSTAADEETNFSKSNLYTLYKFNSILHLLDTPNSGLINPDFVRSGLVNDQIGSSTFITHHSDTWSSYSSATDIKAAAFLHFNNTRVETTKYNTIGRHWGFSLRCLAIE